ncbi:hypothetical protein [Nitrospirillum iridis]|uniref:Uncharacterized protein n=1 Tax=Nitrospirillum iridis TaxID=765888 RepID=A0A7X0B0C6_9PROT|nr:hypothetical protein [Nitrospirillum iridis]MBB6252355.1 hypothetical protein [Nitrospirillum iridis]
MLTELICPSWLLLPALLASLSPLDPVPEPLPLADCVAGVVVTVVEPSE